MLLWWRSGPAELDAGSGVWEEELVRLDYNPGTACSYTAEYGVNISSKARNNILAKI